jgi:hypothetical protein
LPPPPASGPDEPRALSAWERARLADIEHELEASAPELARQLARPMTRTAAVSERAVHGGLLVLALFLLLAVAGLIPAEVWAVLAVLGSMILVPWVMLRAFERFDRDNESPGGIA